ncbi:hypothetical protein TNCV_1137541 [Trichonephila clavipes]|nr:hypothetical protein TNCV_1137541 [Trichonephila clavipes]
MQSRWQEVSLQDCKIDTNNSGIFAVGQDECRLRATTENNDRYILLTARRDRTANATQIQRVSFGNWTKDLKPNNPK